MNARFDGTETSTMPITPDLEGLRRLERRIRRTMSLRAIGRRVRDSLPAIVQITVAVLASYSIAHFGLGHATPVLAVTVAITSLGFNRDARPIRVVRSVAGILLGVALSALLILLIGQGVWQLGLLLAVVLLTARVLVPDPTFAVVAATPAMLSFLLPVPDGGPWVRALDGAIGGAVALAATALIPRDPRRLSLRDARAVVSLLVEAARGLADALADGDAAAAELAGVRLRRAQPLVDAWRESLATARSVARISPFLRARLPELDRQARVLKGADAAGRHLRLIARRVEFMVREAGPSPALADLVAQVGRGVELLGAELVDVEAAGAARSVLASTAARLDPVLALGEPTPAASAVVMQLRPLVVDLLVATGMGLPDAQARLARLD